MGRRLIDDLAAITPVVIDFEYTTPTGARPEPIEVAVQAVKIREGSLERIASWEALMRPPQHAELTTFDTNQTGITLEMLADQPPAAEVLAELDRQFTAGPYLLVAHNAPAEAASSVIIASTAPISLASTCSTRCAWPRTSTPTYPDTPSTSCSHT